MQPDLVNEIARPYLTEGVLGTSVLVLAYVVMKLWNKLEAKDTAHKVELAAKDALIKEIYDDRVTEAKLGYEFAKDYKNQNDALLAAVRGKGTA